MDRNSIIGLGLIAAILIGWQLLTAPSKEELAKAQASADSIALVERKAEEARMLDEQAHKETTAALAQVDDPTITSIRKDSLLSDSTRTARIDSVNAAKLSNQFGIFYPSSTGKEELITIQNDKLEVSFSTKGAAPRVMRLKPYVTYQKQPLILSEPDSSVYNFLFAVGSLNVNTKDLYFTVEQLGSTGVRMLASTSDPAKYVAITYQLDSSDWQMRVNTEFVGLEKEVDPRNVMFNWEVTGRQNEKHLPTEQRKCSVFFKYMTEDRDFLSESSSEVKKLEGRANWIAFKQDFFSLAIIKADGFTSNGSEIFINPLPEAGSHTKRYGAKVYFDTPPSAKASLPFSVYMGPNQYGTLKATGIPDFDHIINLGWGIFGWVNRFLVIPVFNFLGKFNLSYGIIILALTVLIKLVLMPIAFKNQKSSARMRALRPEIDAINKKFPGTEDMMKRNSANMELYGKAGVSPMSGCVPMLLQLPILYAMFQFFPASIELRQQSFLWADDLSSYDSIFTLPFTIPAYGNHVSLFTILMCISTVVYTMMTSKQMPQQPGMPNMKVMMYIFPFMMLFFMNSLPAGLSYYYLLANTISILQMTVLSKFFIDEKKLRAELLANMSKPKKKSKWQQRIAEMQKQQQEARRR